MSVYRFSTAAHFDACLFDRADRGGSRTAAKGLRPFAPFSRTAILYTTSGAHAPAITRVGELLWRDNAGVLHRLPACAERPEAVAAPSAITGAKRIVTTPRGLWVASESTVELYEEETLARLLRIELPGDRIIDIAGNGRDGIFVLVERDGALQAVPVDCTGHIGKRIEFKGIARATVFVYLRPAERFVILAEDRLSWFRAQGGAAIFVVAVPGMRPCFTAHALGSDGERRVFVAGADSPSFGGGAFVLSFDADGNRLGDVPLDPRDVPATGIASARNTLLVTGPRGLLRFTAADTIPDGAEEVSTTLITPMLQSPDREDARRWLRIEAVANLPEGSTLEIAYAAPHDAKVRDVLNGIANDASLTPSQRIRKLRAESDVWRAITFHGQAENVKTPFAAPLFDVRERYLWVAVTLTAAPGARLPELTSLAVRYPGRTLMEHLPSIYQRAEAQPGNFLRALVGVLETTTQELDGRIASMATNIHPSTASGTWLDFLARWLGVPWDDALTLKQKQAIVLRAPELARGRGTRAGLEALLQCLMPETPRRFRVTDPTADFGFAFVGGDGCAGSALPAMLGGLTRWSAELGSRSFLGYMRLPCANQRDDGTWQLAGRIRIDVAASAEERKAWEPWLLALIQEMVPLTVRVEVRWVSARALRGGDRLDGTLKLEAPPAPQLGSGAVTGLARLPDGGARLSAAGPHIGTRLR